MKSLKFILLSLFCLCCMFLNAQTSYKGVYLDRDRENVNVAIVKNTNEYPVKVKFQYKIGSKYTEWIPYINKHGGWADDYIEIEAKKEKRCYISSKIYGLNLIYVDILQPSVGEKILDAVGVFGSEYQKAKEEKAAREANQNH